MQLRIIVMSFAVLAVAFLALIALANGQGNGAIRLIQQGSSSSSYTAGIVEIYYNSAWGNICDDSSFASTEANVICHQLGYTGVTSYGNTGTVTIYGTDTISTTLEDVSCSTSTYLALLQCSVTSSYSTSCINSNTLDAYVACHTTRIWSSPFSGQIRLIGGTYSNFGRLEVYCNSQWGTVCDDSFGLTDATVACRQLGYGRSYSYTGHLAGSSSQPIWLDNVPCSSFSYTCLATCQSCPSSQFHNCGHSEDVALGCDFSSSSSSPTTTTSTCLYADSLSSVSSSIFSIVGGIIAVSVFICILSIAIPLCICCCLGVGIGSAVRSSSRSTKTVVTTAPTATTTAIVSQTTAMSDAGPPSYTPQSYPASGYEKTEYPGYPQQPATGYPQQPATGYPQQPATGYPQQPATGYPQQPATGYPQETGYPPQDPAGYPGYPPQDPAGYPPSYPQQPPAYPPQEPGGYLPPV